MKMAQIRALTPEGRLPTTAVEHVQEIAAPPTWEDLPDKPTSFPSTIPDVEGLTARLAALEYDSGRRGIHEELINGWTASANQVSIQRRGNMVTLTITSSSGTLDGANATSSSFWTLPLGFRPVMGNYGHLGWVSTSGTASPVSVIKSVNNLASSHRGLMQGIIMWPTSDPIPTTLPGSPA